jgi:hypothetical protein
MKIERQSVWVAFLFCIFALKQHNKHYEPLSTLQKHPTFCEALQMVGIHYVIINLNRLTHGSGERHCA